MEFTLPEPKNTSDEYIRDSHTNNYTKIPVENHFIGENVSDMSYVYTSTPEQSQKRKRETFDDICDGTYIYYLCIFLIYMKDDVFFYLMYLYYCVFLKAMAQMFPELSKPLHPTLTPTNTSEPLLHTVTPTNTWNKVDQDIAHHT